MIAVTVARRLWRGFRLLSLGALGWVSVAQADEALWAALRSGEAVALIRHAVAPGVGDPPGFNLDECSTQRNLSEQGRRQARRIGAIFRENGISHARVLSSRWCRCLETARLMDLGPVEAFPALDSFFSHPGRGGEQTAAVQEFLLQSAKLPPRVLVTHQVNVSALTGVVPDSGDVLVVKPLAKGAVQVVGRLDLGRVQPDLE